MGLAVATWTFIERTIGRRVAPPKGGRSKAAAFVVVSGLGLVLSALTYVILYSVVGWNAFWANFVSDFLAFSYVFAVSWRSIFAHAGTGLLSKFVIYLISRLASVLLFSSLVGFLVPLSISVAGQAGVDHENLIALAVKLAVTPASLAVNFLITWLTIERANIGSSNDKGQV